MLSRQFEILWNAQRDIFLSTHYIASIIAIFIKKKLQYYELKFRSDVLNHEIAHFYIFFSFTHGTLVLSRYLRNRVNIIRNHVTFLLKNSYDITKIFVILVITTTHLKKCSRNPEICANNDTNIKTSTKHYYTLLRKNSWPWQKRWVRPFSKMAVFQFFFSFSLTFF